MAARRPAPAPALVAVALGDVEDGEEGSLLDKQDDGTYLINGEVAEAGSRHRLVLTLRDRDVTVHLRGHAQPGRRGRAGQGPRPPGRLMLQRVVDTLLGVTPWLALLIIAALVFGEAALFFGFVLPGETAVVYGGVLADAGKVSVYVVLAVVIVAAVVGDSVGFEVGRQARPAAGPGAVPAPLSRPGRRRPGLPTTARRPGGRDGPLHGVPAGGDAGSGRREPDGVPALPGVQRPRRRALGDRLRAPRLLRGALDQPGHATTSGSPAARSSR